MNHKEIENQTSKLLGKGIKPEDALIYFDNISKLEAFFIIKDKLSEKKKLKVFKEAWTSAEINHMVLNKCKKFFKEHATELMTKTELNMLKKLPDEVIIYRGTRVPIDTDKGISWSLDLDIAKKFTKNLRCEYFERMLGRRTPFEYNLITKKIKKDKIQCLINSRHEKEIIYW